MNDFIGFAGVASAIIASMGLAMWMEWYCLSWLMRVMPGKLGEPQAGMAATETNTELSPVAAAPEPKQAEAEVAAAAAVPAAARSMRYEVRLGL